MENFTTNSKFKSLNLSSSLKTVQGSVLYKENCTPSDGLRSYQSTEKHCLEYSTRIIYIEFKKDDAPSCMSCWLISK